MRNRAVTVLAFFPLLLVACPKPAAKSDDAGALVVDASVDATVAVVDAGTATTAMVDAGMAMTAPSTAAGKTMTPPTPTTDRFARNRDKDPPCPAGFQEEPVVEQHSACARICKTEKDCHGHTCEDSVITGKTCTDTKSKGAGTKAATYTCKATEVDNGDGCYKRCDADKDCAKPMKCQSMMVANPNGGTSSAMTCQKP